MATFALWPKGADALPPLVYAILTEIMYNDREKQGTISVIYWVQKCRVKLVNLKSFYPFDYSGAPPIIYYWKNISTFDGNYDDEEESLLSLVDEGWYRLTTVLNFGTAAFSTDL